MARGCKYRFGFEESSVFHERTVIVLGAGASVPYGFPSGARLIDEAIANFNAHNLLELLHENGGRSHAPIEGTREYFSGLLDALRDAHAPSIDTWLLNRPDYSHAGKIIMAYHLARFEDSAKLMNRDNERWYGDFLNTLGKTPEEIAKNYHTLRIVTFNYDRSFEEFAFRKFKAHYRMVPAEAANLVKSLNIHHVYGQLGALDWQQHHFPEDCQGCVRRYGEQQFIADAAQQVKLIHECENTAEIAEMQSAIGNADFVFLIGFGFHEENIKLLELDQSHAAIYATDKGLPLPAKYFATERLVNLTWCDGTAANLINSSIPFAEVVTGRVKGTSAERRAKRVRAMNLLAKSP